MRTFDAPFGDNFTKPIRVSVNPRRRFPFPQDLTAVLYDDDFVQRAEFFEPLPLGYPHPDIEDAVLVEESPPSVRQDGLFRWTRTFASIPGNRTEFETTTYTFPAYKSTSASTSEIRANFSQKVVAKAVYSYVSTDDPESDLVIVDKFQPLDADDNVAGFLADDTTPTLEDYQALVAAGDYVQATETDVARWMGNVWQMRNAFVRAL